MRVGLAHAITAAQAVTGQFVQNPYVGAQNAMPAAAQVTGNGFFKDNPFIPADPAGAGGTPPMMGGMPPADGSNPTNGGIPPMMGGMPTSDGSNPPTNGGIPPMMGGRRLSEHGQLRYQPWSRWFIAPSACGVPDQHTYAFIVDPPAIEPVISQLTVKCSTECPFGHGQPFKTETGEIFQLACGKRHGTKIIHRDNQATMMDCMNNCGKLMHCDSVDYDIHRRICYYSNHKAEPTLESALFASAYSMGCGICGDEHGCKAGGSMARKSLIG
ncbi:uncharacterized protein PG986_006627 [Apiospora aurea]|uniref:Apple domain-containing protein n=1 Tax=Apiospora aurea TaxID=335848 RepID=A0ABR1QAB4_9PEZI